MAWREALGRLETKLNANTGQGFSSGTLLGSTITTAFNGIPVTAGDIIAVQANFLFTAGATESEFVRFNPNGASFLWISGGNGILQLEFDVTTAHVYNQNLVGIALITSTGTWNLNSQIIGTNPTNIANNVGFIFLRKQ